MGVNKFVDITVCWKVLELGVGWAFPAESQNFFMGTKVKTHHNLTLYLGPFTIDIGRPPKVLSFRCANCYKVIEETPKWHVDCHKPVCDTCHEYNISLLEHMGKML